MESTGTSDDAAAEATDTTPTFNEAKDNFGNALTETTFTDGDFGTIYRAFKYNADDDCMAGDDAGNNLAEETDARSHKTTYAVDSDTSRNEEVTDRLGNKTAYEYDDSGRTTKVTSKKADDTELSHVSYAYDTFDNMTEIVRGDGMKYVLAYNEFHNLESIGIDGKTEKLIRYAYKNGNGRLKQMTYANGHTMKAVYNSIGQMVAEKWFETKAAAADSTETPIAHYKYVYDGDGNIVRSIDISGKKEYNYEYEEGRIVRATEADIELSGEIVTSKVIVNTVKYYYDTIPVLREFELSISDAVDSGIKWASDGLVDLGNSMKGSNIVGDVVGSALVGTGNFIDGATNFVGDAIDAVTGVAGEVVDGVKDVAATVSNGIVDGAKAVWDFISFWD